MADVNGLLSRQQLLKKKINPVKCEHKPAVNRVSVYPPPSLPISLPQSFQNHHTDLIPG